jgi:hypothetical protein
VKLRGMTLMMRRGVILTKKRPPKVQKVQMLAILGEDMKTSTTWRVWERKTA